MPNTVWTKEANEFLISEVAIGFPVRISDYEKIGHGQKYTFWDEVSAALKDRTDTFPNNSFPSGKTCNNQFDKLLLVQQNYKKNHKWKSGSTEDIGEVASGLEEIMLEMEEVADLADAEKEMKAGVAEEGLAQEAEMGRGRVTPKANKKANPLPRPEPEGEPVRQKDTIDSMLIKVLGKKAEGDDSLTKERRHAMEERKMLLKEEEFQESKRVRLEAVEEARQVRSEAREDALRRDKMQNDILKLAFEVMGKKSN